MYASLWEAAGKTPVICLTANVLSGGKDMMLKAGFTDYLTKPVTLNEMEQMLLKYLPADKVFKTQNTDVYEEETTSAIPDAVKAIEEIDISKGLEYCGDEEDYLDALDIFASSAMDKAVKLERCFEAEDYENLQLLSHSLKSTSRAIGASALSEAAASVEAQAKESDAESLKISVPKLLEKYRTLGEKLGKH